MHEFQFSYQSNKYSHADVIINSCKISKHVECNLKKSAEFTSCTVLEKLSDIVRALDHLEIVDTDLVTLQTTL